MVWLLFRLPLVGAVASHRSIAQYVSYVGILGEKEELHTFLAHGKTFCAHSFSRTRKERRRASVILLFPSPQVSKNEQPASQPAVGS